MRWPRLLLPLLVLDVSLSVLLRMTRNREIALRRPTLMMEINDNDDDDYLRDFSSSYRTDVCVCFRAAQGARRGAGRLGGDEPRVEPDDVARHES